MAINPKDGKLLYHLTALENLESIIDNGLKPRKKIDFSIIDIADPEILQCREKFGLEEHTPFHFFCSTPFAGAAQLSQNEKEFIYITITRDLAKSNNFTIIPTHPLHYTAAPLSWDAGIETINWNLMHKRDYSDHECKETCMAESNFKGTVLAEHFNCIYVRTEEVRANVLELLRLKNLDINVSTNSFMFLKK